MATGLPQQQVNVRNSTQGGQYSFVSQFFSLGVEGPILERLRGTTNYDDIDDARLYTSIRHEYTHFVQNLTTSYGLWKTLKMRSAGSSFFNGIVQAEKQGRKLRYPIDSMMKIRGTIPPEVDEFEFPFIVGRSQVTSLNLMEGGHALPAGLTFEHIAPPNNATNPGVECGGVEVKMTASTLLEFQAYAQQIRALFGMREIRREYAEVISAKLFEYPSFRVPQNVVGAGFERRNIDHMVLGELTYELCSLALSPEWPEHPLHALGAFKDTTKERRVEKTPWEQFHPGWRLISMMEMIRSRNMPFPSFRSVPEFVAELAGAMKWVPAVTALRKLYGTLSSPDTLAIMEDFFRVIPGVSAVINDGRGGEQRSSRYIDKAFILFGRENLVRGPLPRYEDLYMLGIICDAAIQRYYSRRLFCPMCLSYIHREECSIKGMI